MKIHSSWSARPGGLKEAVSRFLAGQGTPPAGVKILGRWYSTDWSVGFGVYETDNPAAMAEYSAMWADVMEAHHTLVIEDAEFGAVLTKVFGK